MLEYLWGVLTASAAVLAVLLLYSLGFYALRGLRERRERNTRWAPATRRVGTQTWVVVQQIQHSVFGQRIIAEQLVATITATEAFHDEKVRRKERVAELRAAWLNHGAPDTPRI